MLQASLLIGVHHRVSGRKGWCPLRCRHRGLNGRKQATTAVRPVWRRLLLKYLWPPKVGLPSCELIHVRLLLRQELAMQI